MLRINAAREEPLQNNPKRLPSSTESYRQLLNRYRQVHGCGMNRTGYMESACRIPGKSGKGIAGLEGMAVRAKISRSLLRIWCAGLPDYQDMLGAGVLVIDKGNRTAL